jgi:hypothetical protein
MPITKSELAEYRRLNVAAVDPRTDEATRAACHERLTREAIPALLAEREQLLALLRTARSTVDDHNVLDRIDAHLA